MAGSNSVHAELRGLVAEGVRAQADALRVASSLPLREVVGALDEDFLDQHGESGSRFLRAWLGQLGPFEQMEVAGQIADQHLSRPSGQKRRRPGRASEGLARR